MLKDKKVILVFPGQGSQYRGMGKDLYDNFEVVRETYERASKILGYNLAEQCFKRPLLGRKIMHKVDLNKTAYTQPAVLTMSYACFKALQETCQIRKVDLNVSLLAGHSLGEYTALLVSGAIDFESCLTLVKKRASYMAELGKVYPGAGLMAIISKNGDLDYAKLRSRCRDFKVYITLNNTKKQIVIGGFKRQLREMSKELRTEDNFGTMLKVEGPFHTPIMKPAADRFRKELEQVSISIASKPIIANVSTDAIVDPAHIREELYQQIFNIVDWRGSIEKVAGNGASLFIEIGPKNVLTNMIKDIDSSIRRMNVADLESLERTVKELSTGN